jgi:WD40 repeat protein
VRAVAYHPTRPEIGSASQDGTVNLWDPTADPRARMLRGFEDHVDAVGFAPDGRQFVTASLESRLLRWDAATWARIGERAVAGRLPLRWPRAQATFDAAGRRLALCGTRTISLQS